MTRQTATIIPFPAHRIRPPQPEWTSVYAAGIALCTVSAAVWLASVVALAGYAIRGLR